MTKTIEVVIPRVNTNDDQARVVQVLCQEGQSVARGELLFTIETTKATVDVEAQAAGILREFSLREEDVVTVGQVVARLSVDGDAAEDEPEVMPQRTAGDDQPRKVTAKARKRARQLGVILDALPGAGTITVELVERSAVERGAVEGSPATDSGLAQLPANGFNREHYLNHLRGRSAIVFGGGGHSAVVMDTLALLGVRVLGAVDDVLELGTEVLPGRRVMARSPELADHRFLPDDGAECLAFVGVGGQTDNRPRERVLDELRDLGFELPPLVHPSAVIGEAVTIGEGSCVLAGAVVGPRCRIGVGVMVNQASQLCHDSRLGDYVHLAPGALIAGCCDIGRGTTVGMGATVLDHTGVGESCLIHNGAAVTGNLSDGQELGRDGERWQRKQG